MRGSFTSLEKESSICRSDRLSNTQNEVQRTSSHSYNPDFRMLSQNRNSPTWRLIHENSDYNLQKQKFGRSLV